MSIFTKTLFIVSILLTVSCSSDNGSGNPVIEENNDPVIVEKELNVHFLGNEGFLFSTDSSKIVVDGLFNIPELQIPPDDFAKLIAGEDEYSGIEAMLITHFHADHFNTELVGEFLVNNPDVNIVAPQKVVDLLAERRTDYPYWQNRVHEITPPRNTSQEIQFGSTRIRVLRLNHTSDSPMYSTENLGFIINMDDIYIYHPGDAAAMDTEDALVAYSTSQMRFDIVCEPWWGMATTEGRTAIATHLRYQNIIAMHSPESIQFQPVRTLFPNAILYTTPGQEQTFTFTKEVD